ncbi:MAG TPA: metalloregulator ArsR/SmtB family transcription factor [Rhizomicrobium sp.]|jgi:DNA-binding transcriptional ArsR family regulator|nr:metalloregulator ArsR/SmtB family transcription factor [Rhizomicrobium sp.]
MKSIDALQALSALAQETRLAIFRRLVSAGPDGECAGAIARALAVAAPTLSFHLKELERAGLVSQRRAGRSLIYAVNFGRMRDLLAFLMKDCCGGRPEICSIALEDIHEPASCASSCS